MCVNPINYIKMEVTYCFVTYIWNLELGIMAGAIFFILEQQQTIVGSMGEVI